MQDVAQAICVGVFLSMPVSAMCYHLVSRRYGTTSPVLSQLMAFSRSWYSKCLTSAAVK
jgi:hypothetical protein